MKKTESDPTQPSTKCERNPNARNNTEWLVTEGRMNYFRCGLCGETHELDQVERNRAKAAGEPPYELGMPC